MCKYFLINKKKNSNSFSVQATNLEQIVSKN